MRQIRGIIALPILTVLAIVLVVSGGDSEDSIQNEQLPTVYATFYPYYEFARGVAGDVISTEQLAPDGAQIHDWEPDVQDIINVHEAIALVFSNPEAETYVNKLVTMPEFTNTKFISASPYIDDYEEHKDKISHSWLDPIDVINQVNIIRDSLSEVDPANAATYAQNAQKYIAQLETLDTRFQKELSNCKDHTIITFHNSYTHLANRYGLKVFGIASSHHAESSANAVASMIEYAKTSNAQAIFTDELGDARHERAAAEEIGVKVIRLSTLEGLPMGQSATYFEKMNNNLDLLKEGLRCQ